MNKIQLSLAALALGLTLSAHKCASKDAGADQGIDPMATIAQGKWVLQTLNGKEFQLPEGVDTPYLTLDPTANSVSGFGGCNQLMGPLKVDGRSISFPDLASTKKYCDNSQKVEEAFKTALRATNTYALKGDKLILLDKDKELATLMQVK